jgi:hypothetical protein
MRAAHRDAVSVELSVAFEGLFDGMMDLPSIGYGAYDVDIVFSISMTPKTLAATNSASSHW